MTAEVTTLRRFPGSQRLLLHPDGGRRSRGVRALTGASDWRRDLLDRFGAALVAVTGPRVWPTSEGNWTWPSLSPEALVDALRPSMPAVRVLGAVMPRQPGRRRVSLLCQHAGNPVIVKLGVEQPGTSMHTEAAVLTLLTKRPLPGIATPQVIATGQIDIDIDDHDDEFHGPIQFLATSAIGIGSQRPAVDASLRTFEDDLADRLSTLARPDGDTSGLVPVHGDLTPWNLRRTPRGLALFDWEAAGWGEAGSDLAMYRTACDGVRPWWRLRQGLA